MSGVWPAMLDPHVGEDARSIEVEAFKSGDEVEGWLVRYAPGLAIWCGEISRDEFRRYPDHVRSAMRDDCGWYLVEMDTRITEQPSTTILAKLACETTGLQVAIALAIGRQLVRPD